MCPFKDPEKRREWRRMYYQQHQEEACEYTRKYRQEHLEKVREKDRQFGKQHRKEISARVKKWKALNPEKAKELAKRYYMQHREQLLLKSRLYRQHNPEVKKAQKLAGYHVPLGPECELCGSTKNLERHHPDYSEPLIVVTVCSTCNKEIEKNKDEPTEIQENP